MSKQLEDGLVGVMVFGLILFTIFLSFLLG